MTRYHQQDWYEEGRAYDIVFDEDTPREVAFLEGIFERHARGAAARPVAGGRGRTALEPACGTGRLVVAMAERGWRVTGYDLSEGALAYARRRLSERGVTARVGRGDMRTWTRSARFHLAWNLVSTFKYLLDDASSIEHLERTAAMLREGGLYVLGLHLTDYTDRAPQRERWRAERDGIEVTAVIESGAPDRRRRTEAMRARLRSVDRETGTDRRFETTWDFRTYGPRQLRAVLDAVPVLELVAVHDFRYLLDEPGRFGGDQLDHLLVLRKRGEPARRPRD